MLAVAVSDLLTPAECVTRDIHQFHGTYAAYIRELGHSCTVMQPTLGVSLTAQFPSASCDATFTYTSFTFLLRGANPPGREQEERSRSCFCLRSRWCFYRVCSSFFSFAGDYTGRPNCPPQIAYGPVQLAPSMLTPIVDLDFSDKGYWTETLLFRL